MLGMTWAATLDGALDEISTLRRNRDDALDALIAFLRDHPEHDDDPHLITMGLCLLQAERHR